MVLGNYRQENSVAGESATVHLARKLLSQSAARRHYSGAKAAVAPSEEPVHDKCVDITMGWMPERGWQTPNDFKA